MWTFIKIMAPLLIIPVAIGIGLRAFWYFFSQIIKEYWESK